MTNMLAEKTRNLHPNAVFQHTHPYSEHADNPGILNKNTLSHFRRICMPGRNSGRRKEVTLIWRSCATRFYSPACLESMRTAALVRQDMKSLHGLDIRLSPGRVMPRGEITNALLSVPSAEPPAT